MGEFVASGAVSIMGRSISYPITVSAVDKESKKTIILDQPKMQRGNVLANVN